MKAIFKEEKRSTLAKQVANRLREAITSGRLEPGDRLKETEIANAMNIGRNAVREAIRYLEKEGLVTSIPRKGTFVKELRKKDIEEVFQIREMIECFAIDLIVSHNLKDYQLLDTPLITQQDLPPRTPEDPTQMLPILMDNFRFHISLVEASGNRMLLDFYQTITSVSARCQFKFPYSRLNLERMHIEHKELAALMRTEKYNEAKQYLKTHLRNGLDSLLNSYDLEYESQQATVGVEGIRQSRGAEALEGVKG